MIKQTTTLPVIEADPDSKGDSGWKRWAFVALEVALLGAIPILAIVGFRALLDSRAGQFAIEPGFDDPGWMAMVEPSPISSIVDVDDGRVAGVVLVAPSGVDEPGGAVVLVSGATEVDGLALDTLSPEAVVEAIERELRLDLRPPIVLDGGGWTRLLGDQEIELANPDPVPGTDGAVLVPAGRVVVGASLLAPMSTRLPEGVEDPEALEFRRSVIWRTLLDVADFSGSESGVAGTDEFDQLRSTLESIASGVHRVELLPLEGRQVDIEAAEELIRSIVALPVGPEPGDRLQVRIIDRTGANDVETAARNLGRAGFEVIQVGNAAVFDDGPTQLLVAPGADLAEVARLAALADAATVPPGDDPEAVSTVTLLLGDGAGIALSS